MGVVYEAEDLRLGRHVALKLISGSDAPDPGALERFYREARIASALNHPGICTIYEIDETNGQPFLAMELLDGQPLDRLYAGRPAPIPRLIEIGIQLADALDAAHQKGILHRDMKPANIFVTNSGQAKILDFGLARIETPAVGDSTSSGIADRDKLTRSGATLGTVAYMSPEQARGEALDVRSDLFSLGVVLYEMATGNHPFSGTTSAVVFDKLLNYHPPSASSLNHDLPHGFENLLNKALEKDRDLRYQTASDLRADLRRLQRSSSGIHATPAHSATGVLYPGMTRVGSAQPAPDAWSSPVEAPLQLVHPQPPARRFRTAWIIAGIAALLIAASAIAGIRYFARKRSSAVTNPAVAAPIVTAAATNPAPVASSSSSAPSGAAGASSPGTGKVIAKPTPATPKPSAGTPQSAPDNPRTPPPPTSTPDLESSTSSPSSFEADAGSPTAGQGPLNIPFRRAYNAAPAVAAHHMHRFGGFCEGTLLLRPEFISYTSPVHSFNLTRDQISAIEGDAIVEPGGRRWRFEIPGRNGPQVHALLNRWFNAIPAPR